MLDETAIIGDVHGEAEALQELLNLAKPRVRRLVFLGDLVNRGPSSKRVIDIVSGLLANNGVETVVVAGNHDQAFSDVLEGPGREDEFLRMGGAATIRSYVDPPYKDVFAQLRDAVPARHKDVLTSMVATWESEGVVARHRLRDGADSGGVSSLLGTLCNVTVRPAWIATARLSTRVAGLSVTVGSRPSIGRHGPGIRSRFHARSQPRSPW